VTFGEKVLGLVHLYCTDPLKALNAEDLEFTVAVAKQLGTVTQQLAAPARTLSAENQSLRIQLKVEKQNWSATARRLKSDRASNRPSGRHQRDGC